MPLSARQQREKMSSHEQRQHLRHPASYDIEITPRGKDAVTKTERLHDISDGGISFKTDRAGSYQIGQRLEIGIIPPNQDNAVISLHGSATIIWIQHDPFSLKTATVGVHFDELIESEKLAGS